ncbi:hypothetical protein LCGC14_2446320 [marine sediment metagenome]|uniref:Uncharacterized protein n=1 Tax=marine sediment metagenome TaxID=412755 RepID=A0A0F9EBB8_9ZZZZ
MRPKFFSKVRWNRGRKPIQELIQKNEDINDVDNMGMNMLHWMPIWTNGLVEEFQELVDLGVDVNQATNYGDTPLHLAVSHGETEYARILIAAGANKSAENNQGEIPRDYLNYCREEMKKILNIVQI